MTNKKSIIGISIIFTIVTICVATMLFATPFADTQTTTEAKEALPATETEAVADTPAAQEDPALADPQPNAPFKITFAFDLKDSCPTPKYNYTKNYIETPFIIGKDSITINLDGTYTVDNQCGNVSVTVTDNSIPGNPVWHTFGFITPIGYEPTIESVNPEQPITESMQIKLGYKKYTGVYTVQLTVTDFHNNPVEGYDVIAFLKDGSVAFMGTTDNNGVVTKLLTKDQAICSLVGDDNQYSDGFCSLKEDSYKYKDSQKFFSDIEMTKICPMDQVNIKARSDSEHHNYFLYNQKKFEVGSGKLLNETTVWKPYWNLAAQNIVEGEYKVLSNGAILHTTGSFSSSYYEITITPVSKDGTPLNHWLLEGQANGQSVVYPGDTFSVPSGGKLFGTAVYEAADPTVTAQTGDSCEAALPLAILAIVSAATLIARRKISRN